MLCGARHDSAKYAVTGVKDLPPGISKRTCFGKDDRHLRFVVSVGFIPVLLIILVRSILFMPQQTADKGFEPIPVQSQYTDRDSDAGQQAL
jgi:hypothetical protein